ncbi:MAG: hypothetical protein C0501_01050 [Isosphaera sp.]|nr:hypothetical protein [Isosphaera sp.]
MSLKFRPQLQSFEDRVVPAAFSFRLADGTVGSGHFATPAGVNPTGVGTFVIDDMTLTYAGVVYVMGPDVLVDYEDGRLVGLTATAAGAGPDIALNADEAEVSGVGAATIMFDGAATQITFDLTASGSSAVVDRGAVSYDVPYHTVDPTLANQTVTLTDFKLNIAGRNLTTSTSGVFATAPTALFAFGVFQGVTFAADTSALADFPYTSLSLNGLTGAAQSAGQTFNVNAAASTSALTLDFSQVTIGEAYIITIDMKKDDGTLIGETLTITVGATATRAQLVQAIVDTLEGTDFKTKVVDNVLTITTPSKTGFRRFEYVATRANGTHPDGPTFKTKTQMNSVKVNGVRVDRID